MNIFSFTSLFKKKQKIPKLPNSVLTKKLKRICKKNALYLYENITIYHHSRNFFIPLLILDPQRAIYLVEYKEWSHKDLLNVAISKATHQEYSDEGLAYEKAHEFIKQKFNELIHNDGIEIYNYLLLENISDLEYEELDDSFKELVPKKRVIFNSDKEEDILNKLQEVPLSSSNIAGNINIMGHLLTQYLIFTKARKMNLATKEQIEFIESDISGVETLAAPLYSGKTNTIMLKTILEYLRNPKLKIIIIEPTIIACDILKQKLLNLIEYAIIEVDISAIEIITPLNLLNKHLNKLKKPSLEKELLIDEKLMKKNFKVADLIICDDSELMPIKFVAYLRHIQKKSSLLLVRQTADNANYIFKKSFKEKKMKVLFKEANQHAKSLQIIASLLKEDSSHKILVISNDTSKQELIDDLEFFVKDKAVLLENFNNILLQELDNLILCSYAQISSIEAEYVILLDVIQTSLDELEYAMNIAQDTTYILYEQECENIKTLKEKNV